MGWDPQLRISCGPNVRSSRLFLILDPKKPSSDVSSTKLVSTLVGTMGCIAVIAYSQEFLAEIEAMWYRRL